MVAGHIFLSNKRFLGHNPFLPDGHQKTAGLVYEKNDPYYYNVTCVSTNNKDCGVGNFLYSKCSCCNYGEFRLTKLQLLSVTS